MRNSGIILALLSVLCLLSANAVAAPKLYKWIDAEGNIQYSQTPPSGAEAEEITVKTTPSGDGDTAPSPEGEAGAEDEDAIPESAGQDPEVARQRQSNCEVARSNLKIYKEQSRLVQPDGSSIVISDEMREMKIREAEEQIEEFCP